MVIGPFTPGPTVADLRVLELFAEVGVVLLMFSIGIEFELRDLLRVKWVALVGGPLGIVLSVLSGTLVGHLLGWPPTEGLVIGAVVSVASTMVLARLLMDRGELHSRHGRVMIGIALVEDLAVVVLTVLMPALGSVEAGRLMSIGLAFGQAALILVPFAFLAARVMPSVMGRIARTHNDELFLLIALALGLGTAALTQAVGMSLALGAFLAGLLVSNSDYAHETLARLLPLRDAFVALFFVTLGALMDPATVFANLPLLGAMLVLIVPGKFLTRAAITWAFGYPFSTALRVGVGLGQIGEFSFILVQVARSSGLVGDEVYNATLAAALLSILINAALVRYVAPRVERLPLDAGHRDAGAEPDAKRGHVVICGFGRVGSAVGEALDTFHVSYTVIDRDPEVLKALRQRGVFGVFGDGAHRDLLIRAGAERASLVVVALPEIESARLSVRAVRALRPDVPVLARAHHARGAEELRTLGATEVIQPEVEAGATLIRHTLALLAFPKEQTLDYLSRFRAMDTIDRAAAPDASLPGVHEIIVPDGIFAGQSLREARVRERFGVTVVGISGAEREPTLNPPPETILRPGDRLRVFGLPEQIEAFMEDAARRD
jgi:CPA2 family monovalent cation:H+ antiporter-2